MTLPPKRRRAMHAGNHLQPALVSELDGVSLKDVSHSTQLMRRPGFPQTACFRVSHTYLVFDAAARCRRFIRSFGISGADKRRTMGSDSEVDGSSGGGSGRRRPRPDFFDFAAAAASD